MKTTDPVTGRPWTLKNELAAMRPGGGGPGLSSSVNKVITEVRKAHAPTYTWQNRKGVISSKIGWLGKAKDAKSSHVINLPDARLKIGRPTKGTRADQRGQGKYGAWIDSGYSTVGKGGVVSKSRLVTAEQGAAAAGTAIGIVATQWPQSTDNLTADNATKPQQKKVKKVTSVKVLQKRQKDAASIAKIRKRSSQKREMMKIGVAKNRKEAGFLLKEGASRVKKSEHITARNTYYKTAKR